MKKRKAEIHEAVRDETQRCIDAAAGVLARYEGMGFRHNAAKADAVREVLKALGAVPPDEPYQVTHIAGLTAVFES